MQACTRCASGRSGLLARAGSSGTRPPVAPWPGKRQRRRLTAARSQPEDQQPPSSSSSTTGSDEGPSTSSPAQTQVETKLAGEDSSGLQIPRDVVERLKMTVFGLDTMWVTSVENYQQDGVVFKGNVRAKDPAAAYARMQERLKRELGDAWQIFLVEDKDEKPTAVVLPGTAREGQLTRFTEIWLTATFALLTAVTSVQAAGAPIIDWLVSPFTVELSQQDVLDTVPLVLAFWFCLGAHEAGHLLAARARGVQLYLPLIVPAGFGFLGSFGGITRFKGFCPDREALLDVAVKGPVFGAAASATAVLLGLALSAAGMGDVAIDSPSFADSLAIGVLAQLFLGDALSQPEVQVSSLLIAGWAGLAVNALNVLPLGELDGGRISLALFGRRGGTALSVLSTAAVAIGSFSNPLLFYWILFVLVLQRGPILPCQQELAQPQDQTNRTLGYAMLALPVLVLLPYPQELAEAIISMQAPTPFLQ